VRSACRIDPGKPRRKKMIYTLLTFGLTVILMAGMILAARVRPQEDEPGRKSPASRRLDFIRKSSLLR
jgi:hypothetical protein